MYNYKIKDIAEKTGLKELFVRRCIREMKDFFEPHIERGVKNSLVLDSNVMPIFDKIKQDKDKGISLSTIRKNLLNSSDLQSEDIVKVQQKDTKTEYKTTSSSHEWLSIKDAAKLSKRSETTIRRLIPKLKVDSSVIQKEDGEKGKWLISKKYISENFDHNGYTIGQSDGQCSELSNEQSIEKSIGQSNELFNEQSKKQVIELLEKQIEDLQEQLEKQ
ncbi:MAG: hypothetical protein GY730_10320, partial [bacterium]|nr:hypothetical protein [bacterium]